MHENGTNSKQQVVASYNGRMAAVDSVTMDMNAGLFLEESHNKKDTKRNIDHATSSFETLVHLLKGNLGPGILNIPQAFMYAGLYVGLLGIPIIGFICIHCMQLLLKSSKILCERTGVSALSYEETAETAFTSSPFSLVRKYAKAVKVTMSTFLVITQLGFCCVYFVFVPQNMYQAIECMTGGTGIPIIGYMGIMLVPVLLMSFIAELKYLTPISLTAGLIQTVGFVITFYYLIRDLGSGQAVARPFFAGWRKMPLYFSSAIYAFEGIGLILPLENKMKSPRNFGGALGVLNCGMTIVVILFAAVGYFGYLQYGDDVQGSITLNLPPGEVLAQCVKLLMGLSVFLTYPIQFYVPSNIITPLITNRISRPAYKMLTRCIVITLMVLFTFTLAAIIPNIGLFINLVGAVSSSTLAIIFPPLVHLVTVWPDTGRNNYVLVKVGVRCLVKVGKRCLVKAIAIVLFGLAGFVTGTYASLVSIIDYLVHPQDPLTLVCV
ncbi:Amino acid transporter transmembrane domain [Trinorchestia longiramus]|nr:Amino acid transporter transmembrane domain [Trinorchestia longiramus]